MDFSALSSELQNIAGRYNGRDTDPAYSTTMYCEMFHKILQKTETEVHDYADQIVILWMTLSQLCNTANTLAPCPARNELYQDIFLQCAKTVLNIKWQNLAEDDQSKENFTETVKATHVQLVTTGFDRFSLLLHLMENPWTDPTLSEIMSGEADNDDDAVQEYIRKESSLILKLRVEMLMQENCEEFALNLCNTLMGHEVFVKDMDLRETQLKLLHKLNQMDKLQEVCEKIVCHDGVKLVLRLEQKESNQALSVRLIQLFLVQDWIKPEQKCCTQELLKLWIRHQYIADHNKEKFLDSVWAIAKLSLCTQQILLLVSGLHRECGNEMIQLYTDLCVYAVNVDKGCCEQQMLQGNMEGVKERQHAIAQTCRKLSALYNGLNPKISRISSLTAFSLDASLVNLCLVERMFNRKYCTHSKKECAACIKVFSSVTHCVGDVKVNPATLYEVERLLNMLRPYYLNPDLAWKELLPVCQKFMKERSQSSSLETKEETTPPKTPPKKKSDSKPKAKKSSAKKEMSVSPGNIKYYCDDNVSYLPKESVPKMKNKNFRMKLASASSCTQTPKPDDSKVKPHTVKPAATPSKASTVFEFDKQLYQYNFKGKPSDSGSSSSSTVVKEQMSPAGSELSNSFANNHPKTPTQIANLKCQAVGVDSLGQPVLVKLPISVSSPSTATIPSSISGVVGPSGARQRTMYIGDPTVLGLHTPNPNTGLHITGQGKIQKPKKRQPHSIGELLEATKIMPCSTSSNFSTAASNMTSPKPSSQHSLPTSADLLRAARDYNLTIVQKPVTPKPFHTQYSTADLLRATKNIPQKSKPELQSASNLQSAKDMVQATKAAFAASVLGFIPKPQSTILSEVSQGVGQTSLHSPASAGSVGTSGSELKPTKKPKAPRKPKAVIPGQVNQKAKANQVNVSQCNSVQTTSNKTIIAHSYKTVDGSISFLSSNVTGASNTIPTLVNKINAQSQSPVRPPANSYQVITSDKSNHRPRIIPIRATCNSKFPPYSSAITSDALSPGQVVGANTTVTTSAGSITSTHAEHDMYNIFTKEKPAVKQSPTTAKIGGFRRPSADELQSIVDWLQTGTEDDKKKMQVQSPVSAHVTQEVVTTVPSTVQSRTPTSVVTPTVTSASSFVLSPAAVAPKTVSLTQEQLQKIMSGLSQRQKIKQKSPSNKMQQKKSLNKQLQQLLAQDIKIGNQLIGNRNNFVQQNPLQKSQGNDMIIQSSATQGNQLVKAPSSNESQLAQSPSSHANQLVQPSLTQGNQLVQPSSTQGNQLVQPSSTQGNQLVQPALTQGNQLVQPSSTQGNQLVQPSSAQGSQQVQQGNQLVQPSLTQGNQLVQPSVTQGNQLVQPSVTQGNQLVQPSSTQGIQLVQPSVTQGNQLVQPSLTQGNQLVQPSSTQGIQLVQPSVTQGSQQVQPSSAQGSQQVQPSSAQGNQLVQPTLPGIPLVQPSSSHANQLVQPLTSHESQLIQSSLTQENQLVQPLSSLENQLVQTATPGIQLVQQSMPTTPGIQTVQPLTSATQGNNLIQSSLTYVNPLVQSLTTPGIQLFQSSTHGSQLVQPSLTQGHQLVQSALPGIQLVQSSTLGDQLVQPTAFENQLVQSSITPGIQLVQSSPALEIQLLQSSMTDGSQLVQPTTSLGNQLVHTTFSTGMQPIQSTSSYGRQLSFNENLLVQASASQGYRAIQPAPTPENQAFQPIPSVGNQLSLGQENQAIQSPLTQGTPAAQPVLTMENQPIQLSQNQEVVSGNPLIQSTIPGISAGNQQLQPSQVQEVSDPLLTLGSPFVKPQLIAPALTLPVSSQVTVSQSLTSTDQVTSAIQTTSTTGIQQSLSFPSQFQISGSKSLTMSPNQSTTRVHELQYLGQINPPSKILHPKPPSEDSSLVLATTASGDQVGLPGKVLDHLPEMNIKAANEIQGLLKSKQPTFIPKTISSEDELNIPKMPLGTLKVVENPDLVSTLFGKNRNSSKLSIDNNHSVAVGGSVEKTETSIGKQEQRGGECEPAVSSSSDYDGSVNNIQGNGSPTQTLPSHDSTVCNMPSTTKVPYPQNDKSAQKHTSTSQDHLESTNNEDTSFGGKVRDVPHALDNQTTCNTTTSEFTISSSSVTDKDVGRTDGVDTTFPVNSGEKVLETNLDNTETSPEKESDLSLGMVDGTTCPDSTTQITNSDGDAGNNLTVGNNQYSCDGNDVQPPANYTEEKNDEESTGGQVLDLFPVSDIEQATTNSLMLPTPKGDNLEGTILSMEEAMEKTPAIDPTERVTDVQEQEAPCSSSYDSDQTGLNVNPVETICPATNLSSSGMEESSMLIRKDNLEEDKSLTDFQKVKGLHSDASKLSSFGKKISEEIENTTNVMGSPSTLTTPSTEHVEKAPIPEKSKMLITEEMRVPSDVTVHTSGNAVTPVSTDKDSEKNEVLNAEECFVKADKEDTVKPIEDMSELVLNLDDALGESATLLSTPVVACVSTDPTQQMAEDNLTPELRNSVLPNRVEVLSLDRRDADDEKSNPEIQTVPSHNFKLDNIKDYQVTDKKSMESPPLLQDTQETGKHPEQEKEVSSDSLDMKEGIEDIEPENKQSLIINNPDLLEKDSIPNKAWENAFVSFIDNMGEKKMVKTDNSKVHIKPVFSRQDSSGSESSSRSVGSSLGSRGSHRSSLDEESSGTRILPLQRRENDVKRFEYFSYHSSSHKSNKKRLSSKSVTGLQIQALPEIKAKSKHTMKLVPAAESTEVQQPKEVVNKCIICCKVFRSVESLKCHVRNICRPIDSRPDSNLKDFEYSTTYSCHKCEKEVSKKEEMKAHVAECFKDDDVIQSLSFSTKYMCQMCGEFFTSKDDVHSHVSRLCSKVMSCRQQQQDRLDRKTELTAKPLSDMVESWYSNDETHTDDTTKEKVPEETHESEEKKTLGLDDLELEIFNESNNHSDADTKEESKSKVVLSKKRKHQVSNLTLPSKQWSLRNKTKFSSRLKGFEFFTNKLNPARRRTEQRKWHEDYHSLRNRVVKKEAVKQVIEDEEVQRVEPDGKTYVKHAKFPRVTARGDSIPKTESSTEKEIDASIGVSSKSNEIKLEKKESNNTEVQNHTSVKSKGPPKDVPDGNTMDPPLRQKRVIQVGRKFLQDEFEVPEFLKIQVANTNLKRKSPQHCPKCGQFFSSSYILIQHVVRVHMSPCKSKWNSSARKSQYPCWYCSDAFPTYAKFAKHVPVHKDKILAMLKKSCSTNRRLRKGTANINNVTTKASKTGISKTRNSVKSEPVSSTHKPIVHRDPSPVKESEAQALSQHVESMRTSRRARGQPPLALDASDLKVEMVKKERSRSREKDLTPVSGLVASVIPGTLDMRTTRSRRRDNDSMSTSSFDHDDDLASNCSHATDKSSQSRGKRDYNKRGLSEDRESMTSDDSVCHRPVTRHQGAAHVSPPLQDSQGRAKKPKLAGGHSAESDQGRRSRTRSGNVLSKITSIKCNDLDKGMSDKDQAETKSTGKVRAVSTNKIGQSKGAGSLNTYNQSKEESDKKMYLSVCVSQLRQGRKEAKTDQNVQEREISDKGPDGMAEEDSNTASNMTTRRSRRLNNSLKDEKGSNKKNENSRKREAVDGLNQAPVTRHKNFDNKYSNSKVNKSGVSEGKTNIKSKLTEKVTEPRKRKFPAKEIEDDNSKKCVKNETEGNKKQSLHVNTVDQKSVLIVSEEDEEFVYVKSPLSSPSLSPRGINPVVKLEKAAPNSKPVDGKVDKSAFIDSFKKYIHKPTPRWAPTFSLSKKSNVSKSKLRQKVCHAQARLLQKKRKTKMESPEFSSEDEADDELDEDVQESRVSEKSDEKKSFLDSFIAHCDKGPRLKVSCSRNSPSIVPKENITDDSAMETLPNEKKQVGGKRKLQGQASQGHQVKKEVIRTIENTESKVPVTVTMDARQSKSQCVKEKADEQPAESKDKELDLDCSEEVKSITESKDCKPCVSVESGSKLDPASARPTSFESLQTYIDSMSNSASPTPSVDSTTSKDTHSRKSLKISKSMASTFQDSFMTYLGSKPKKSRKTSDNSCSSSECGDVKSCSSSVCDGDTGNGQKSRGQKSHASKPFTWDMDSGDERIDLLVSTLGRVVTETSETGAKPHVIQEGACSEEAQSETSVSARSSVERILPNKHSHSKTKVRRIYHDGKIWEIGHGSVKSVSVVQSDILSGDKVPGRDSPVSDISDCGESNVINNKSDPVNVSRLEQPKGDNRISPLKSDHHHLSKSSKTEQNVQANVEMIRVDRKHDGGGFVRLDKSEIDQYDKMNTYTSVTPEDMALKKTENIKKSAKWKVKTEKRSKSSNMKEFPFVFKKNRRM